MSAILFGCVLVGGLLTLVAWAEGHGLVTAVSFAGFCVFVMLVLLYRDIRNGRIGHSDDLF